MSTCLHQAYIEQMFISTGVVFVINIKLSNNLYLDLRPNHCEFINFGKIDFETPIDSPFNEEYIYHGIDNTSLVDYDIDENNIEEEQKELISDNRLAKENALDGIIYLLFIYFCKPSQIFIKISVYNKFKYLKNSNSEQILKNKEVFNNFLKKLNNNNKKNFYLINIENNENNENNENYNYNYFTFDNNDEFAIIIDILEEQDYNDYGNADSVLFLSIMHQNSKKLNLNDDIINYLKETIKQYYIELNQTQLKNFNDDHIILSIYIENLFKPLI